MRSHGSRLAGGQETQLGRLVRANSNSKWTDGAFHPAVCQSAVSKHLTSRPPPLASVVGAVPIQPKRKHAERLQPSGVPFRRLNTVPPAGVELLTVSSLKTACEAKSGADSGAVGARDDGLDRLAELWPMLSADDRKALIAHAEHLAALRPE